jgi:PilZ domain-containing protein
MEEVPRAPRHRVLKAGTISFGGAGISCTIRNLSDTGAALEVTSPIGIPQEFILLVEADHSSRQCRVVWRKEHRIGVTFGS